MGSNYFTPEIVIALVGIMIHVIVSTKLIEQVNHDNVGLPPGVGPSLGRSMTFIYVRPFQQIALDLALVLPVAVILHWQPLVIALACNILIISRLMMYIGALAGSMQRVRVWHLVNAMAMLLLGYLPALFTASLYGW